MFSHSLKMDVVPTHSPVCVCLLYTLLSVLTRGPENLDISCQDVLVLQKIYEFISTQCTGYHDLVSLGAIEYYQITNNESYSIPEGYIRLMDDVIPYNTAPSPKAITSFYSSFH